MLKRSIDAFAGEQARGAGHIRTVNGRHSRLEDFLRRRRGIAIRRLDSCPGWFHPIDPGISRSPGAGDSECAKGTHEVQRHPGLTRHRGRTAPASGKDV